METDAKANEASLSYIGQMNMMSSFLSNRLALEKPIGSTCEHKQRSEL